MQLLKKFECAVCGCESANFHDGGRYCQKCKLIYGYTKCREIADKRENNHRLSASRFFRQAVEAMTISDKLSIAKQLGGFPKVYNEQSKLDAERVNLAEKDGKKVVTKLHTRGRRGSFKTCACCRERFKVYDDVDSNHCAVCWNVFGPRYLKHIDKLPDERKCKLYKIRRAKCSEEVKDMTPTSLHQNLQSKLNIRLAPTNVVVAILMRVKIAAQELENEKHKKTQLKCCKCGNIYFLEGEHPEPFICDQCKVYDEEHRRGTKLRDLPGLPSMTYEHLALLPEYAACMFTKHMTSEELGRLKKIRAKNRPPKKSFTELIDDV